MAEIIEHKYALTGASPLMFGKYVAEPKKADETHDQYEHRTWKLKVHTNDSGHVYINPFALKNAIETAGSRLGMKLTGKSTYTKLFRQGILVVDPLLLYSPTTGKPITIDDIVQRPLFVPSTGKRGDPKRVMRIFPELRGWTCEATVTAMDGRLTDSVVRRHIQEAGMYIGFGSMRVEYGGINGRFSVE